MDFDEYQRTAQSTDRLPQRGGDGIVVPLLGMSGEVASLQVEYKKWLRDGQSHLLFQQRIEEELGDVLWYVANLAWKFDISLDRIAQENLAKTRSRWPHGDLPRSARLLDEEFPESEQFPRNFRAEIAENPSDRQRRAVLHINGERVGDELDDNTYVEDGYKFHDVLHLAHMTMLGWSPTLRKLMELKRRSNQEVDDFEDGGRAIVIDEAIVAFVFEYAERNNFLEHLRHVDFGLLQTIKELTARIEVQARSEHEWEEAILKGYEVWRQVKEHRGGIIHGNLINRTLEFEASS